MATARRLNVLIFIDFLLSAHRYDDRYSAQLNGQGRGVMVSSCLRSIPSRSRRLPSAVEDEVRGSYLLDSSGKKWPVIAHKAVALIKQGLRVSRVFYGPNYYWFPLPAKKIGAEGESISVRDGWSRPDQPVSFPQKSVAPPPFVPLVTQLESEVQLPLLDGAKPKRSIDRWLLRMLKRELPDISEANLKIAVQTYG